jgi:hypothetical protein
MKLIVVNDLHLSPDNYIQTATIQIKIYNVTLQEQRLKHSGI